MATLLDLEARVYERLGLSTTDGLITSSVVRSALNRALDRIETEREWPWLQTTETLITVEGQVEYTPAADWGRTLWLAIGGQDLQIAQRRDLQRLIGGDQRPVTPAYYSVFGEKLILGPPPTGGLSVTHAYTRHEPALVLDGDSPLLPSRYDDLLVVTAAIAAAVRLKDREMVVMLREERRDLLAVAVDDVRRATSFPQVKTRRDW